MLKIAGAVMVMVGMVGLAWHGVGRLRERAEILRGLQGAVAYLEEELAFRFTPLPKLFDYLRQSRQGMVGAFFQTVWEEMECQEIATLQQRWSKAVRDRFSLLKDEERQMIEELGEVLGRYDAQTQAQALRLARERLANAYIKALEERQRLGRVYLTLGAVGGLMTVLVLI